ncbi:TPA: SMI1/KNR4 family protein [Streptococcus suis]|uniref:SMI1/KNR4 family protein n=1 Tax=Streptococcus suis TaxID=1307 RepID=UPI000CF5A327|nr:SMI1/KNR4 family protein [Streptococcus suis]MBY4955555.1 SMI1/KNR4 family protein [Streptococcus suis]MBY4970285.1 SMI1/KNR4 family protein [Streptococcus suis]MBY5016762.1 SMI1/KNR4 family protein [Streptococcus suis]NQJ69937.1 SMI1/KNR4 family protein [Streptococcus suis]NQJ73312.1 SMI1/KNR4 family protein [Streptococcus suis]
MDQIVEKYRKIDTIEEFDPATEFQVTEAERRLGLEFPREYVILVKEFGAVSFYATEWNGFNTNAWMDVVESTLDARDTYVDFPKDKFVLESLHVDELLVLADSEGRVFLWRDGVEKKIRSSISEYLDECISRR